MSRRSLLIPLLVASWFLSGWPQIAAADTIWSDGFETDKSWTGYGGSGEWERQAPGGLGGEHGNADPSSAHGSSNVLGNDLSGLGTYSGDYELNLGQTYWITSPAIDCSSYTTVHLLFWRWLNVETSTYDHAYLEVSNDGSSWTPVFSNSGEITDSSWSQLDYDISSTAGQESTVYIRFGIGTTDGGWQYSGWNIDDLEVTGTNTPPGAPALYSTDSVQLCFNNAKINDDTPTFRVAATDPQTDPVDYRIEIDDDAAFGSINCCVSHYLTLIVLN